MRSILLTSTSIGKIIWTSSVSTSISIHAMVESISRNFTDHFKSQVPLVRLREHLVAYRVDSLLVSHDPTLLGPELSQVRWMPACIEVNMYSYLFEPLITSSHDYRPLHSELHFVFGNSKSDAEPARGFRSISFSSR